MQFLFSKYRKLNSKKNDQTFNPIRPEIFNPIQARLFLSFNPIQARLFYRFKGPRGVFTDSLIISGTIKASPMKLCTVIVLLNTYRNTKLNFQKYDL